MNSSDLQNATVIEPYDPWEESGAMVYVAITVATFSMLVMCCTWCFKRYGRESKYSSVGHEEEIELTSAVSSEDEEIPLAMSSPTVSASSVFECEETASVDENETEEVNETHEEVPEPDPSVFSIEDPEDKHEADDTTTV